MPGWERERLVTIASIPCMAPEFGHARKYSLLASYCVIGAVQCVSAYSWRQRKQCLGGGDAYLEVCQ